MGKWAKAAPAMAYGDAWRKRTPSEILYGCFVLEPAAPIWSMFRRLSRGRNLTLTGHPCPLNYRDIYDASRRVHSEIDPDTVEQILTDLDDLFFELVPSNGDTSSGD